MIEKNSIINADCLEAMKDIPDGSIDLIVTDPPYIVNTTGGGGHGKQTTETQRILERFG